MNSKKAIYKLNTILAKENPSVFSSSWIFKQSQPLYNFFSKKFRTENGDVDWDKVTIKLDKSFQRRWIRYKRKKINFYSNKEQVEKVLEKYRDKLYLFLTQSNKREQKICNNITISLVRLSQKGNLKAKDELVSWVSYIVNDWIDKYPQIHKWKGYPDEVSDQITGCIYRYRYTGSFLGYLFKTLEFSARGKPPIVSFDDKFGDSGKARIDFYVSKEDNSFY